MDYQRNPFVPADTSRHAIWEMLVTRDIDAFLARDWSMVADDFIEDGFFGLHAHGRDNLVTASMAMDENGRFQALRINVKANMGAYLN